MTGRIIELVIVIGGLALSWVLFYRFPLVPNQDQHPDLHRGRRLLAVPDITDITDIANHSCVDSMTTTAAASSCLEPSLSVIIPARNEEKTLPLLLADLHDQSLPPTEIICVDDASVDATAQIAHSAGVRVLSLHDKPSGWIGKSWACQSGADAATGDVLLFLDADVRLGPHALARLMQIQAAGNGTVSIQPYHRTEKAYEQLSMIFNLALLAANGMALPRPLNVGLCGPIILISRADYLKVGKHETVKGSVVEDVALGLQHVQASVAFRLFLGDSDFSFRMYGQGWRSLLQGWIKNQATGAATIPWHLFVMVFFWITSMASVPLQLMKHLIFGPPLWLALYSFLYLVWMLRLFHLSSKAGCFQRWAVVLFPIPVITYLGVFVVSMVKKLFRMKVTWKGRAIDPEEKSCK